ncbi:MAG TPA: MarR family transcriptional regulator [Candidatus Woesearchaeota archaeon]|nr:MarR family transcriptional regulator [Candidatus Woesearchaeota archaeon]
MKLGIVVAFVAFVFLALPALSFGAYYAEASFDVMPDGSVMVSGISNYPGFAEGKTQMFTSKDKDIWAFSLSTDEVFSEYIFSVELPRDASISYLKAPRHVRIETSNGRIGITALGKDEPIDFLVQYRINASKEESFVPVALLLGLAFLLLAGIAFALLFFRRGKSSAVTENKDGQAVFLTERQREIVSFLEKQNSPVSQARIEEELGIPKSSLSRNIETLLKKGIINKDRSGMSSMIWLER